MVFIKISNIEITKQMVALGLTSTIALTTLTACNKQIVDYNKYFNVAIETNADAISVSGVKKYNDYSGSMIQLYMNDGLVVLTNTRSVQLMKVNNSEILDSYINSLTTDPGNVNYSSEIHYPENALKANKDYIDLKYVYKKAIILNDNVATIVNISSWRNYEEDDKIQITLEDGETVIFTEIDNIKIIDDSKAPEDSIKKYAASLVGNEENVKFYNGSKGRQ